MPKQVEELKVDEQAAYASREARRQKALKHQAKALESWFELKGDSAHKKGQKLIEVVRTATGTNRRYVGRVKEMPEYMLKVKDKIRVSGLGV